MIAANVPLAGRLKHFLQSWEILTKDPEILVIVKWFKIAFIRNPTQQKAPKTPCLSKEQAALALVI